MLSTFATGRATWLVSQDNILRKRAARADLMGVISLADAVETFQTLTNPLELTIPASAIVPAYTVSLDAEIFESLKRDYANFLFWWRAKVVAEQRSVIVLGDASTPEGIAVLKVETDQPYGLPDPVLKMCTFKISDQFQGAKRGELLLKACIELARGQGQLAIYMEVLPDKTELLEWLGQFGFRAIRDAGAPDQQLVMRKHLTPPSGAAVLGPLQHAIAYGPGSLKITRAHVIPIRAGWHHRLLPEAESTDGQLFDLRDGREGCGNAVRKAYLCNASTRKVQPGDGVLFIRTGDGPAIITSVGVVEQTCVSRAADEVAAFVGTRTVYSYEEIERLCGQGDVLAILFRFDRALSTPLKAATVQAAGHLKGTVQSITEITPEAVAWVRQQLGV